MSESDSPQFQYDPTIWFPCKLCERSFRLKHELREHRIENHIVELREAAAARRSRAIMEENRKKKDGKEIISGSSPAHSQPAKDSLLSPHLLVFSPSPLRNAKISKTMTEVEVGNSLQGSGTSHQMEYVPVQKFCSLTKQTVSSSDDRASLSSSKSGDAHITDETTKKFKLISPKNSALNHTVESGSDSSKILHEHETVQQPNSKPNKSQAKRKLSFSNAAIDENDNNPTTTNNSIEESPMDVDQQVVPISLGSEIEVLGTRECHQIEMGMDSLENNTDDCPPEVPVVLKDAYVRVTRLTDKQLNTYSPIKKSSTQIEQIVKKLMLRQSRPNPDSESCSAPATVTLAAVVPNSSEQIELISNQCSPKTSHSTTATANNIQNELVSFNNSKGIQFKGDLLTTHNVNNDCDQAANSSSTSQDVTSQLNLSKDEIKLSSMATNDGEGDSRNLSDTATATVPVSEVELLCDGGGGSLANMDTSDQDQGEKQQNISVPTIPKVVPVEMDTETGEMIPDKDLFVQVTRLTDQEIQSVISPTLKTTPIQKKQPKSNGIKPNRKKHQIIEKSKSPLKQEYSNCSNPIIITTEDDSSCINEGFMLVSKLPLSIPSAKHEIKSGGIENVGDKNEFETEISAKPGVTDANVSDNQIQIASLLRSSVATDLDPCLNPGPTDTLSTTGTIISGLAEQKSEHISTTTSNLTEERLSASSYPIPNNDDTFVIKIPSASSIQNQNQTSDSCKKSGCYNTQRSGAGAGSKIKNLPKLIVGEQPQSKLLKSTKMPSLSFHKPLSTALAEQGSLTLAIGRLLSPIPITISSLNTAKVKSSSSQRQIKSTSTLQITKSKSILKRNKDIKIPESKFQNTLTINRQLPVSKSKSTSAPLRIKLQTQPLPTTTYISTNNLAAGIRMQSETGKHHTVHTPTSPARGFAGSSNPSATVKSKVEAPSKKKTTGTKSNEIEILAPLDLSYRTLLNSSNSRALISNVESLPTPESTSAHDECGDDDDYNSGIPLDLSISRSNLKSDISVQNDMPLIQPSSISATNTATINNIHIETNLIRDSPSKLGCSITGGECNENKVVKSVFKPKGSSTSKIKSTFRENQNLTTPGSASAVSGEVDAPTPQEPELEPTQKQGISENKNCNDRNSSKEMEIEAAVAPMIVTSNSPPNSNLEFTRNEEANTHHSTDSTDKQNCTVEMDSPNSSKVRCGCGIPHCNCSSGVTTATGETLCNTEDDDSSKRPVDVGVEPDGNETHTSSKYSESDSILELSDDELTTDGLVDENGMSVPAMASEPSKFHKYKCHALNCNNYFISRSVLTDHIISEHCCRTQIVVKEEKNDQEQNQGTVENRNQDTKTSKRTPSSRAKNRNRTKTGSKSRPGAGGVSHQNRSTKTKAVTVGTPQSGLTLRQQALNRKYTSAEDTDPGSVRYGLRKRSTTAPSSETQTLKRKAPPPPDSEPSPNPSVAKKRKRHGGEVEAEHAKSGQTHDKTAPPKIIGEIPGGDLISADIKSTNIQVSTTAFPCNICPKICKTKTNLSQHMRIHNVVKPPFELPLKSPMLPNKSETEEINPPVLMQDKISPLKAKKTEEAKSLVDSDPVTHTIPVTDKLNPMLVPEDSFLVSRIRPTPKEVKVEVLPSSPNLRLTVPLPSQYKCDVCPKVCKTKRSLTQHKSVHKKILKITPLLNAAKGTTEILAEKTSMEVEIDIGASSSGNGRVMREPSPGKVCELPEEKFAMPAPEPVPAPLPVPIPTPASQESSSHSIPLPGPQTEITAPEEGVTQKIPHSTDVDGTDDVENANVNINLIKSEKEKNEIHGKEKFYKCETCGKKCSKAFTFQKHIKSHANNTLSFHLCQFCGRQCMSEENLKVHEKTHSGIGTNVKITSQLPRQENIRTKTRSHSKELTIRRVTRTSLKK